MASPWPVHGSMGSRGFGRGGRLARFARSQLHAFDFGLGELALVPDVETGGARIGVSCERLRIFEPAAVFLVQGDAGGAKGVIRDGRGQAGLRAAALDGVPDLAAGEGVAREG